MTILERAIETYLMEVVGLKKADKEDDTGIFDTKYFIASDLVTDSPELIKINQPVQVAVYTKGDKNDMRLAIEVATITWDDMNSDVDVETRTVFDGHVGDEEDIAVIMEMTGVKDIIEAIDDENSADIYTELLGSLYETKLVNEFRMADREGLANTIAERIGAIISIFDESGEISDVLKSIVSDIKEIVLTKNDYTNKELLSAALSLSESHGAIASTVTDVDDLFGQLMETLGEEGDHHHCDCGCGHDHEEDVIDVEEINDADEKDEEEIEEILEDIKSRDVDGIPNDEVIMDVDGDGEDDVVDILNYGDESDSNDDTTVEVVEQYDFESEEDFKSSIEEALNNFISPKDAVEDFEAVFNRIAEADEFSMPESDIEEMIISFLDQFESHDLESVSKLLIPVINKFKAENAL